MVAEGEYVWVDGCGCGCVYALTLRLDTASQQQQPDPARELEEVTQQLADLNRVPHPDDLVESALSAVSAGRGGMLGEGSRAQELPTGEGAQGAQAVGDAGGCDARSQHLAHKTNAEGGMVETGEEDCEPLPAKDEVCLVPLLCSVYLSP